MLLAVTSACSGDDDSGGGDAGGGTSAEGWLEQWPGEATEVEGHQVKVDEAERMIYVQDCDVARELTATGGAYNPDDGENGYAYICDK